MTERSRFWNGIATGDASEAPYDAPTEFAAVLRSLATAASVTTNLGGVFRDELNELAVTAPGAVSPASVNTGRALAYGTWYENEVAVSVAIPTPAASTRIDRIVLRKDWAAQTVRVTRIPGVEGGAAPAMTQVAGTTWDTPLAQVSITTGGVITLTDGRELIPQVSLNTAEATLGADVTMTNANTYYDGPSISLTPGTWFITGTVTVTQTTGGSTTAKLWDGTTVEASTQFTSATAGAELSFSLSGLVTIAVTTAYKISVASDNAASVILAACPNNGAGNNASHIQAVRVGQ